MRSRKALLLLLLVSLAPAGHAQAPARQAGGEKTVWYFYRVKWGFQDEFQSLFTRNHLPVLREQIKAGRLIGVKTYVPSYHGDGRADWTFAVVIVYKDVAAFVGPSGDEEIQKRLYPDRAKFLKEEQRRFEILDAHWDVPLNELDLR
jgi:uncharacterized protein CbrC (UPF0167 family)